MAREWKLKETDTPNLLEEQFDYSLPPRICWEGPIFEEIDGKVVKFDPQEAIARDLVITDTTFRDGQQARPPYTVEQQVTLFDMMAKLGGPNGVIRQSEFFLYTKNDRKALEDCRALGHRYPEITSWIRANKGDFRLVKEAGVKETGMLTSSSDYHIFFKAKKNRQQVFNDYLEVVEAAWGSGNSTSLPSGRRDQGGYRRLRPSIRLRTHAPFGAGQSRAARKDPSMRYHGIRAQLSGGGSPPIDSQADL